MPVMRAIALPADKYYVARGDKARLQPIADEFFAKMVDDLTRPLTPEEAHPSQVQKQLESANVKVTGKSYEDAYAKVNEMFLESRWADGLPIVPPTPELVKAMEAGTTLSPQDVLGQVAPKNGTATVEKIAINSVMAGAKPEYFPVILAAMEGFLDKHYDLTHVVASTGSFTPVVIVDGPIAKELDFNSGIGMLGIGWQANSTVGRALELSLLNLGQTWPQVNFMGLTGRLEGYTFYTFAEDTAKSPWEPFNVGEGFQAGDSTVTVSSAGTPVIFGGGAVAPWTAQGVIDQMATRESGTGAGLASRSKAHRRAASRLRGRTREPRIHAQKPAGVSVRTYPHALREAGQASFVRRGQRGGVYPGVDRGRPNPAGPRADFPGQSEARRDGAGCSEPERFSHRRRGRLAGIRFALHVPGNELGARNEKSYRGDADQGGPVAEHLGVSRRRRGIRVRPARALKFRAPRRSALALF